MLDNKAAIQNNAVGKPINNKTINLSDEVVFLKSIIMLSFIVC